MRLQPPRVGHQHDALHEQLLRQSGGRAVACGAPLAPALRRERRFASNRSLVRLALKSPQQVGRNSPMLNYIIAFSPQAKVKS